MSQLIVDQLDDAALLAMSADELVDLNSQVGEIASLIKAYRQRIMAAHGHKVEAERIRATFGQNLSPEQVEAISVIVRPEALRLSAEAIKRGALTNG